MNIRSIPVSFIIDKLPLEWSDVLWGYKKAFLGWRSVIDIAKFIVSRGTEDFEAIELAGITKDETWKISDLLEVLSDRHANTSIKKSKEKWLFLILSWIYVNRSDYEDPLDMVEIVFEQFDCPKEIAGFVAFLPPTDGYDPTIHTLEENEARLYKLWSKYIEDTQRYLSVR
ncbi:MAG: DUF2247 family protein [Candidatus Thiodiazotropha sp.]